MKRSQRFSNWAAPGSVKPERAFVEKMEVALLRETAGIASDESMADLVCHQWAWDEYKDQFKKSVFDKNRSEADWYHHRISRGLNKLLTSPPDLELPERATVHGYSHAVYWATDFGQHNLTLLERKQVKDVVIPFMDQVNIHDPETNGQSLLTRQCSDLELPEEALAAQLDWFDNTQWDWATNYHPLCVTAILCALRGD